MGKNREFIVNIAPNVKKVLIILGSTVLVVALLSVWARFHADRVEPLEDTTSGANPIVVTNTQLQTQPPVDAVVPPESQSPANPNAEELNFSTAGRVHNDQFRYSFDYPAGTHLAKIYPEGISQSEVNAGLTFDQLRKRYGSNLCWVATFPSGATLSLSAKDNAGEAYVLCQRSGVGVCDLVDITETATILGQTKTVKGTKFDCLKSEGYASYEFSYDFPDKTRLHFTWAQDWQHPTSSVGRQRQEALAAVASLRFDN